MNRRNEFLYRVYLVFGIMLFIAVVLVLQTVRISLTTSEKLRARGDYKKLKFFDIDPIRGDILSDDGELLATSIPYFDLHLDLNSEAMTEAIFQQHVDSLALILSKTYYPKETALSMKYKLTEARKSGERYFRVTRRASFAELEKVKLFPLIRLGKYKGGLIIEREISRMRPYQDLARRTIGLYRKDGENNSVGLERYFDKALGGEPGKRLKQRVGNGVWVPVSDLSEIAPVDGMDLKTTIDINRQDIVHHALLQSLEENKADYGCAVVMEVETGKIKAIANLTRSKRNGTYSEAYNHAIADPIEPGSTIKVATVLALLEDGVVGVEDTVYVNHGRMRFGRHIMKDSEWHKFKYTTVRRAFEISSNVAMASLANTHYGDDPEKLLARFNQFGLSAPTGVEIVGEGVPKIKDPEDETWSGYSIPWMAHGYELSMTPLQLLQFYNGVANDGMVMKPYLVEEFRRNGRVEQQFTPEVAIKQMASKKSIQKMQALLRGVAERGTAERIGTGTFTFAGKTGTTQLEYWKGEDQKKYISSFAGYFPAEDPVYSCIVVVVNPKNKKYYGADVAGPVFTKIAEQSFATDPQLFRYADEQPKINPQHDMAHWAAYHVGFTDDMTSIVEFLGLDVVEKTTSDWTVLVPDETDLQFAKRSVTREVIPNVVGMGLRDAVYILENIGLQVKINGVGRVKEQSITAGTKADGQRIMLYLG